LLVQDGPQTYPKRPSTSESFGHAQATASGRADHYRTPGIHHYSKPRTGVAAAAGLTMMHAAAGPDGFLFKATRVCGSEKIVECPLKKANSAEVNYLFRPNPPSKTLIDINLLVLFTRPIFIHPVA